jgi:hypothetical protein
LPRSESIAKFKRTVRVVSLVILNERAIGINDVKQRSGFKRKAEALVSFVNTLQSATRYAKAAPGSSKRRLSSASVSCYTEYHKICELPLYPEALYCASTKSRSKAEALVAKSWA